MGKLKVAKKIPFLVSITYDLKEEIIEQVFSFQTTNKKYLKYAYDQRFCLKRKLEKLINKELLSNNSFVERIEYENKIVIKYRNDFGESINPLNINGYEESMTVKHKVSRDGMTCAVGRI